MSIVGAFVCLEISKSTILELCICKRLMDRGWALDGFMDGPSRGSSTLHVRVMKMYHSFPLSVFRLRIFYSFFTHLALSE